MNFSTNIASAVICLATSQKFNFSKLIFDEPFNDTYETPKHTKKVFTNMKRKRKGFSGRITPLFASMLAPPVVGGEDVAVFKEWDGRVVRATTSAASLDVAQASGGRPRCQEAIGDLTDFIPPTPYDSPLSGGHTPRSDEAIKESKRLEKALRERTPGMKLFKIGTSRRKGLDKENVSKQGRKSDKTKPMFEDSNFAELDDTMENVEGGSTAKQITTAGDTLSTASINVSIAGPSNVSGLVLLQVKARWWNLIEPTPKNPRKAQIQMDEELAQRLFEEEQAQFEREQWIARERATEQEAKDVALIEQMEDVQPRMDADELLAARL
ncbi:hypothetical protein Tco_1204330 [Tanacetum coccineum]